MRTKYEHETVYSVNKKWPRLRDSNPRSSVQSAVCYRYTKPETGDLGWVRTTDPRLKRTRLYLLSYEVLPKRILRWALYADMAAQHSTHRQYLYVDRVPCLIFAEI